MNNKLELLKKLKALSMDNRGNDNERETAEKRLNELMKKYNITDEDIEIDKMIRRDIYFRDEWEHKLICQTIYKLFDNRPIYKQVKKRNWIWCEMTDAEYLEFEMHYCAYKASFQKEFEIFYYAFISKNHIFSKNAKTVDVDDDNSGMSRGDLIRAGMMAQGIESTTIRRLIGDGENK